MAREVLIEGVQYTEDGTEEYLIEGVQANEDQSAVSAIAPGFQGIGNQFVAFHDGTIDPTMHKIESGISA